MTRVAGVSLVWFAAVGSLPAVGVQGPAGSVWDGVYTAEQADRGRMQYETKCVRCHSADLSGANARPLAGEEFMRVWRGVEVSSLVELAGKMPPGEPGVLGDAAYVDIVTYVLQSNGFPAGDEELTRAHLGNDAGIVIEGPDGPQPPANFSLVQIVGCLTRDPDGGWLVTDGSEPLRMRDPDSSTGSALVRAEARALGDGAFALMNVYPSPGDLIDRKVEAKGFLIRGEPDALNTTAVAAVGAACP